ncbi:hypothetical protein Tco_1035679 [Tanacetum coccineum]
MLSVVNHQALESPTPLLEKVGKKRKSQTDFDDDLKELSVKKCLRLVMEDAFPLHNDEASQPYPSTKHGKKSQESDQSPEPSDSESSSCFKTFKTYDNYVPVTERVLEVYNAVKEDPALNKKVLDGVEAYTKNLSNLTELLNLVKDFTFPGFKTMVESLQAAITTQNAHLTQWAKSTDSMAWSVGLRMTRIENTQATIQFDLASLKTSTTDIKALMIKMYCALSGHPFSAPQEVYLHQYLKAEKKKETPSRPEGEKEGNVTEEMTLRVDKGKGIATKTDPFPPKLVKASKKVCQNPNALILIDWEIDVKMVKIINDELQAILDKKVQMKQVVKEVELSKPKVMKVVTDVVIKAGLIVKGSKDFIKY